MIKSVFVRDNHNRLRFFLYKSIPQGKDTRFAYFKQKVMEALDAAESKLDANKITKAVEDIIACSMLEKTIEAHTNDVHTWSNGRRYKKLPSGRWAPVYDEYTRGAKQAINAIKRKADACTNSEDLLQLILDNRSRFEDKDGHPYPWIKDLHDYVSKRNDGLESMPEAIKHNVEAYKRIHSRGETTAEGKDALKDMKTIVWILSTGQKAIVTNPDGEAIEIRKGSVNKSGGLLHIISRRLQERVRGRIVDKYEKDKIIKDTAAVIYLVYDAVKTRSLEKQIRGNWATEKNGIKAVVDKDKNSKRLLTGFDLHNKREATDAINAVIANYNYKPAFLEIYEQVGAVFTSLFGNIS